MIFILECVVSFCLMILFDFVSKLIVFFGSFVVCNIFIKIFVESVIFEVGFQIMVLLVIKVVNIL